MAQLFSFRHGCLSFFSFFLLRPPFLTGRRFLGPYDSFQRASHLFFFPPALPCLPLLPRMPFLLQTIHYFLFPSAVFPKEEFVAVFSPPLLFYHSSCRPKEAPPPGPRSGGPLRIWRENRLPFFPAPPPLPPFLRPKPPSCPRPSLISSNPTPGSCQGSFPSFSRSFPSPLPRKEAFLFFFSSRILGAGVEPLTSLLKLFGSEMISFLSLCWIGVGFSFPRPFGGGNRLPSYSEVFPLQGVSLVTPKLSHPLDSSEGIPFFPPIWPGFCPSPCSCRFAAGTVRLLLRSSRPGQQFPPRYEHVLPLPLTVIHIFFNPRYQILAWNSLSDLSVPSLLPARPDLFFGRRR